MLYIAFGKNNINKTTKDALKKLSSEGKFYQWISDHHHVSTFPQSSKKWFEFNVTQNSTIILKRGNNLLFRKPKDLFYNQSEIVDTSSGYSDYIVEYDSANYKSLKNVIENNKLQDILEKLILLVGGTIENDLYPNIFFTERIIDDI